MAEYKKQNLPSYEKLNSRDDFSASVIADGHVLLFSEDGESLTAKLPDGSFVSVGGIPEGYFDITDATAAASDIAKDKIGYGVKDDGSYGKLIGTKEESSGSDFYKCAAVYGPYEVMRVTVSGAGTTAVNGEYEKTGFTTESGGEVWKHTSADYYVYDYYDSWCLYTDYTMYPEESLYYSYDGISGSWSTGSGSGDAPTVIKGNIVIDADVPKTWDGYKVTITEENKFSFAETVTSGLTYDEILVPETNKVYPDGAIYQVSKFKNADFVAPVYYAALTSDLNSNLGALTASGTATPNSTYNGKTCVHLKGKLTQDFFLVNGNQPYTLSVWVGRNSWSAWGGLLHIGNPVSASGGNYKNVAGFRRADDNVVFAPGDGSNGDGQAAPGEYVKNNAAKLNSGKWTNVVLTNDGTNAKVFIDGVVKCTLAVDGVALDVTDIYIGGDIPGGHSSNNYITNVQVYDYAMPDEDVANVLFAEEYRP